MQLLETMPNHMLSQSFCHHDQKHSMVQQVMQSMLLSLCTASSPCWPSKLGLQRLAGGDATVSSAAPSAVPSASEVCTCMGGLIRDSPMILYRWDALPASGLIHSEGC